MKSSKSSLAGFASVALLVSCGGSDDSGAFGGPSTPLADLPAVYAEAVCEAFERCAGPLLEIYLPGEDCAARTEARQMEELPRLERAIEDGRVVYRGEHLAACADEVRAKGCEELLDRESELCRAALDGTVELGGTCAMSAECEGDAYCDFDDACPGACSALEPAGGACGADGHCASGLVCSEATSRCVVPAGPGELCDAGEPPCRAGYACAGADDDEGTSGTCRSYAELLAAGSGEACDPIAGELCDPALVCVIESFDATSGLVATCQPKVASGAACAAAFPDQCPVDEFCELAASAFEGTCRPRPGIGESCAPGPFGEGFVCAPNTRCNGGTCRAPANLGETCGAGDACLSERCLEGACVSGDSCD